MRVVELSEVQSWTGSGKGRYNEDFALVLPEEGILVLVDGATGLTKTNICPNMSDASWYSRRLTGECARSMRDLPMGQALMQAGQRTSGKFLALPGADSLQRIDMPNGSLSAMRWTDEVVEVAMLGDCTAVVGMRDGTSCVLHDATLDALDDLNYERMYRYAMDNGVTMAQARVALNDRFIENRLKMNQESGYWAADISCAGFGHELVQSFAVADVSYLFACSDGFANAVNMGVVQSVEELAHRAAQGEGERIGQLLRDAEQEDAQCLRVHRSKTSDDATYAVIRFGEWLA